MQAYLRLPTVNPPGQVAEGANWLAGRLNAEGIPAVVEETTPGLFSVLGPISGTDQKPPILLVHHIDTVPVERNAWFHDPFSGERAGDEIWGRGALDDKGPTMISLAALIGSAGCALSANVLTLIAWRMVQAVGACASVALSRAMVRDLYDGNRAAQMLSTLITVMAIPPLIGPLAGGQIVALADFPDRAGAVSALTGAIQYGSGIIGSALVGPLADGTPLPMGWVISVTGIGSLLCLRLTRPAQTRVTDRMNGNMQIG